MGSGGGKGGPKFKEFGHENDYFKLGSEDDYVNLSSAYTPQYQTTSENLYNQGLSTLTQSGALDPNASLNLFLSQAPELQNLVSGATSDFENSLTGRINRLTGQAVQTTANEFANMGALYSGGFADIASQRALESTEDLTSQLMNLEANLTGQLYAQGMTNAQQSVGGVGNLGLSMMGTGYSGLSALGTPQYANPYTYASPQVVASQGGGGGLAGALSGAGVGGAAAMALSANPATAGALIGGGALLGYYS